VNGAQGGVSGKHASGEAGRRSTYRGKKKKSVAAPRKKGQEKGVQRWEGAGRGCAQRVRWAGSMGIRKTYLTGEAWKVE